MNLFDWVLGTGSAVDQGNALDAQLKTVNDQAYAPGGMSYNSANDLLGTAAAQSNIGKVTTDEATGSTAALIATGDANYDATHGSPSADWGKVFNDLIVLVFVAGAIWLFLKLGGFDILKKAARA